MFNNIFLRWDFISLWPTLFKDQETKLTKQKQTNQKTKINKKQKQKQKTKKQNNNSSVVYFNNIYHF